MIGFWSTTGFEMGVCQLGSEGDPEGLFCFPFEEVLNLLALATFAAETAGPASIMRTF
jgi:hypothetical protein